MLILTTGTEGRSLLKIPGTACSRFHTNTDLEGLVEIQDPAVCRRQMFLFRLVIYTSQQMDIQHP